VFTLRRHLPLPYWLCQESDCAPCGICVALAAIVSNERYLAALVCAHISNTSTQNRLKFLTSIITGSLPVQTLTRGIFTRILSSPFHPSPSATSCHSRFSSLISPLPLPTRADQDGDGDNQIRDQIPGNELGSRHSVQISDVGLQSTNDRLLRITDRTDSIHLPLHRTAGTVPDMLFTRHANAKTVEKYIPVVTRIAPP